MGRLAEEIIVHLAGEAIMLRPSLRHALRLERRPGSFKAVLDGIEEGSLTVAAEIIRPHAHDVTLDAIFAAGLAKLREPLTLYVLGCAGIDPETAPARRAKASGKPLPSVPFSEHLASLYRIGTGWLGWTPDVTLDATPAEITEAYRGRVEMLRSIFGSSEDDTPTADDRPLDDKIRTVFGTFGTTKVTREPA
ncbi:hypothetical protein [Pinisolibacter sp.]|uniref:hypothetical protein n=1 Tax=Pinisolibacter sp. TaxID=2172024 RepID=UPI002FDE4FD9